MEKSKKLPVCSFDLLFMYIWLVSHVHVHTLPTIRTCALSTDCINTRALIINVLCFNVDLSKMYFLIYLPK